MRVMAIVKSSPQSEAGIMPDEKLMTEMGKFNEEMLAAGVLLAAEGLQPSAHGARVLFSGDSRTVQAGPFGPPEQLVAGFWLLNVASLDEAIAWIRRCPKPMTDDCEVEIRPFFEMDDFGDELTPTARASEAQMRAALAGKHTPS